MLQLHCPRCHYATSAASDEAPARVCPDCSAKSNVEVLLCAVATLPRPGFGPRPEPAA